MQSHFFTEIIECHMGFAYGLICLPSVYIVPLNDSFSFLLMGGNTCIWLSSASFQSPNDCLLLKGNW